MVGKVALEVIGVDLDDARHAARAEANHDPVMARSAATPRLPTRTHVARSSRQQQVVHAAEMRVRAGESERAIFERAQIEAAIRNASRRFFVVSRRLPARRDRRL